MSRLKRGFCITAAAAVFSATALPALAAQKAPDDLYRAGLNAFSEAKYGEAAERFQTLVDQFAKEESLREQMEGVYYALGCSYFNEGRHDEAIKVFEQYVKAYPEAEFADEAIFRVGNAHQAAKQYAKAIKAYRRLLEAYPASDYGEDAASQIGLCYLIEGNYDKAGQAFEAFREGFPDSDLYAQATMFLARALFEEDRLDEAVDALGALEGQGQRLDHIAYANFLAIEIGDAAFDNTDYELALRAYRRVRTKESLLRIQEQVLKQVEEELNAFRRQVADPDAVKSAFRQERRLLGSLKQAHELMNKVKDMPDYDVSLFHRVGRCFFNIDRFWEARVAFKRVIDEAREEELREAAHFDLILVLSRMRQFDNLIEEADVYLERYDR